MSLIIPPAMFSCLACPVLSPKAVKTLRGPASACTHHTIPLPITATAATTTPPAAAVSVTASTTTLNSWITFSGHGADVADLLGLETVCLQLGAGLSDLTVRPRGSKGLWSRTPEGLDTMFGLKRLSLSGLKYDLPRSWRTPSSQLKFSPGTASLGPDKKRSRVLSLNRP